MEIFFKIIAVIVIVIAGFTLDNGIDFKLRIGLSALNAILCGAIFLVAIDIVMPLNNEGKRNIDIFYYIWIILICLGIFFMKAKYSEYIPFLSITFFNLSLYVIILYFIGLIVKTFKL